jgi:hypothetical protein
MKTISKIQSGIHFQAPDSRWVMKITPDRKIVINEDVEVSEAAMTLIGIVNDMTKPKEWQSLSDAEISDVYCNTPAQPISNGDVELMFDFAKAIEAKLREKNG